MTTPRTRVQAMIAEPGLNRLLSAVQGIDRDALMRSARDLPDGRLNDPPRRCAECHEKTYGSRGPGGNYWAILCSPCKAIADAAAERTLTALVGAMKAGERVARPKHTCRLCHSTMAAVDGRCPECDWDGESEGDTRDPGYSDRERCDGLEDGR